MLYLLSSVNYTKVLSLDNNIDRTQYRRKLEFSGRSLLNSVLNPSVQLPSSTQSDPVTVNPYLGTKYLLLHCSLKPATPNQTQKPTWNIFKLSLMTCCIHFWRIHFFFCFFERFFLIFFLFDYLNDTLRKVQTITMVKINLVFLYFSRIFKLDREFSDLNGVDHGWSKFLSL